MQIMRKVKAWCYEEEHLFSKEALAYHTVPFFTLSHTKVSESFSEKIQEWCMTGSTFLCKANSPCGADISANNNFYQDYLLQGIKINLFFQLLSNEMYQLPFEWWHMAVIYSSGDKSCLYKVLRAPSWTTLITDVNNDRGLLSHLLINPQPHCSVVLCVRQH